MVWKRRALVWGGWSGGSVAVLMLLVHGIQAALLTLIAKDLIPLTARHYISVLLFGFFTMLELREQLFHAAQAKSGKGSAPQKP